MIEEGIAHNDVIFDARFKTGNIDKTANTTTDYTDNT